MERYKKLRLLGSGTYGIVWLAEDQVTHRLVAIKKLRFGKMQNGVNFTAIREIKILQELKHPNIVGVCR